ncbi:T9SS type A sorting domain-containing protein [soil metagenome]
MKKILLLTMLAFCGLGAYAQTAGDYRSAGNGDWNVAGSWQMYNGTGWIAAIAAPTSADGLITILSPHTITANTAITADQVIVDAGATLNNSSLTLSIVDGPGNDLTVNGTLDITNTLSGAGAVLINGTMNWFSGSVSCPTTIAASGILNLSVTGAARLLGGLLTNNGLLNITGGSINTSGGELVNNGIFNKTSVETTTSNIDLVWSNAGTINVITGELANTAAFGGGRTFTNTGTINVSAGADFSNQGYFYFDGGAVTGTGNFNEANGTLVLDAALTIPPSIHFNYTSGTTFGTGNLTITDFTFTNGTINGPGILILIGTTTWLNGTINRDFTIANGNTLNLTVTGSSRFLGGTLTNDGTTNITGGSIINSGGNFINNAIFNKTVVETITSNISVPFVNNATGIIKGTGELNFTSSFTDDGIIAPGNSPGLLTVNGTQPFSANSTLAIEILNTSGVGTGHDQVERSGNLTLNGTLTVTELAAIPLSSYTIINLLSGTISGSFTTVNLPPGYTMSVNSTTVILNKVTIIPLNFISFNAVKKDNTVLLNWVTDHEANTAVFEIQRSNDGTIFESIGSIASNNNSGINVYRFADRLPLTGINYYRLKQVDITGRYVYSVTIKINFLKLVSISLSPNPVKDILHIAGAENFEDVKLVNIQGSILLKMKGITGLSVKVNALPAGQYFIRFIGSAGSETVSFIKQ